MGFPALKNRASGFSLMEVLASLVILSVVATGVMGQMSLSKRAAVGTEGKIAAILIAERKMAEIKADFSRTGIVVDQNDISVPELGGFMDVGVTGSALNRGLKRVEISVDWKDKADIERHEKLVTYMYKE